MCFGKLSILLLLNFSFVRPDKLCNRHSPINAVEDEYFSICCPAVKQDEEYIVNWYREKEGEWMAIQEDRRIDLHGTHLQFWPVVQNDTGNYNCCISNGTQLNNCYEWFLNVLRRDKESCFNKNHVLTGISGIVGRSYKFQCDIHHSANVINIIWYKNCIRILNQIEEEWHIEQLKAEDAGNYTCVASFLHAGRIYNVTRTTGLKVEDAKEDTKVELFGSNPEVYKTEIGKEEILNCTGFLGYANKSGTCSFQLYWTHKDEIVDSCNETKKIISPCQMEERIYDKEGGKHVSMQLWIKRVKEEDINSSYICIFSSVWKSVHHVYILQKEPNPDLPIQVFTNGILMAILFSFTAVLAVILCAVFRVDLVLLYRDITGKDETFGDGKIYDAFVSYLKDSMPVCDEERKFALDTLPKTLEEHFGYRLCIFERDVLSGGAVVDDVQSFIDRSRRLIIILSKNYTSDKVMFELEVGLHKALVERKIKVILIEYMPINNFDFLPKSLELLSSSQVVKWKDEKSLPLNSRFWKKLRYAMPAKSSLSNTTAVSRLVYSMTECEQVVHSTPCSGFA